MNVWTVGVLAHCESERRAMPGKFYRGLKHDLGLHPCMIRVHRQRGTLDVLSTPRLPVSIFVLLLVFLACVCARVYASIL